ncbi:unnamed protein product [Rotaria sp. Silwood1]|nr:unnamed protein product [Rotaria sp. Silwood1]
MTCPCHQADYIGETSLSLAERLLYHQEHGNRIVQEVLLGKKNVTRIRPELKSFETLVKDDMKLYQHSANCPAAIQWFLDENPAYWPFVPIKISEAEEFDEEREVAHSLEDTTQFTYANDIPTPPSGYRFTFEQKMAIEQFFQERKYINSPNYCLDLYHAAIVAILPEHASAALRRFVEALFITHAETKLNTIGHLDQWTPLNDTNYKPSIEWCRNLSRRSET